MRENRGTKRNGAKFVFQQIVLVENSGRLTSGTHSAVDHETASRRATGIGTQKMHNGCGHLFGRYMPSQRYFLLVEHLLCVATDHLGHRPFGGMHEFILDRPGTDRIHGYSPARDFFGRAADQADQRMFGGDIGGISRHALNADHTGRDHDPAIVRQVWDRVAQGV